MRLTEEQIRRLAEALLTDLLERGDAQLKVERGLVQGRIESIIRGNLEEEAELEREAQKLLAAHLRGAPAGIDPQRLLAMIKKKLAEERGLPL